MSKKREDLIYGMKNEIVVLDILKSSLPYCNDITKTNNKFHAVDYQSDITNCELKSRRIKHDDFPTALINCSKIEFMKRDGREHNYLVWNYLDGIYYLKVEFDFFDMLEPESHKVYRDGKCQTNDVYKIHHRYLTKL